MKDKPTEADESRGSSWDQAVAEASIGKTVLVGITYLAADGRTVKRQTQYYGPVIAVEAGVGVTIACRGGNAGETLCLPPDMAVFTPAAQGEYRLRASGEVVVDPDFITQWTLTEPVRH